MATKWQYVSKDGFNLGVTAGQPSSAEVVTQGGETSASYVVGVDDKYNDYPHKITYGTVKNANSNGYSNNYRGEYYLLLDSSNGSSFDIGESVTQVVPGIDFNAVVSGFNSVVGGEWTWNYNNTPTQDVTTTALMTIRDCGPTGGTASAGPTGPTGGTAGWLGGPQGKDGNPVPIVGASSAASWNVIGISQRISPSTIGGDFKDLEIDAVTADDFSSLVYTGAGATINMTNSITDLGNLYETVSLNHTIYGTTHANYTATITVYDTNNVAVAVNAISGGTPDTSVSELNTLWHTFSTVGDAAEATKDTINIAYTDIGISAGTDSVRKVRQFYTDRN